jgi:putative transcriptional regulator
MSIRHHPADATLMGFAAGTLSEPFSIVVSAHLEFCPQCRRTSRTMAALGAATMQGVTPVALQQGALEHVLSLLDVRPSDGVSRQPALPASAGDLPEALATVLGCSIDAIKWRKVSRGAEDHRVIFPSKQGVHSLRFLRAKPGMTLPEHAHVGTELTLVLRGALRDGDGLYGAGDVTDMDDEGTHSPKVEGADTCICVIANEAPSHYTQLKMRIFQKLAGI